MTPLLVNTIVDEQVPSPRRSTHRSAILVTPKSTDDGTALDLRTLEVGLVSQGRWRRKAGRPAKRSVVAIAPHATESAVAESDCEPRREVDDGRGARVDEHRTEPAVRRTPVEHPGDVANRPSPAVEVGVADLAVIPVSRESRAGSRW
jgi:hypothetical protein